MSHLEYFPNGMQHFVEICLEMTVNCLLGSLFQNGAATYINRLSVVTILVSRCRYIGFARFVFLCHTCILNYPWCALMITESGISMTEHRTFPRKCHSLVQNVLSAFACFHHSSFEMAEFWIIKFLLPVTHLSQTRGLNHEEELTEF